MGEHEGGYTYLRYLVKYILYRKGGTTLNDWLAFGKEMETKGERSFIYSLRMMEFNELCVLWGMVSGHWL